MNCVKRGLSKFKKTLNGSSIEIVFNSMPRFDAKLSESFLLVSDVYLDGINTHEVFSFPSAYTAKAATNAESTPPDKPIIAFLNPHFLM